MAPRLADFPDEILGIILRNFCLHCTREHNYDAPNGFFRACERGTQDPESPSWYPHDYCRALYSMCLVSRRFVSVAQPLLYHDFLPGYGDSWRSKAFSWAHRLAAFLRTIAQRRDLAASVHRIYVHPNLLRYINPEEAHSALDDAAHLANLDVAAYATHFEKIFTDLQANGLRMLGVVLALASNLDRLSLQVTEETSDIPALSFQELALAFPEQKPLSKLKTLDICCHSDGRTLFGLEHHAIGILEVAGPFLETLNLHMCGAVNLHIGQDTLHLRHLRVTQGRLSEAEFEVVVSACAPGLETFVYEATYPFWWHLECMSGCLSAPPTTDERQPTDKLFRYLAKFRATLKSLHFDLRCRQYSNSVWDGGCIIPLAGTDTLQSFTALEDVFMSASLVCSFSEPEVDDAELLRQLLPPNIRALKLAGRNIGPTTRRLTNALLHLAKTVAQGDGRFGALEHVRCDEEIEEVVEELAVPEVFASAGVDFGFESWPLSEATVPRGAVPEWGRITESAAAFPTVQLPMPLRFDPNLFEPGWTFSPDSPIESE